jgi:MYXO-CTERM domain-containing protein
MNATTTPRETAKRDLAADDIAGVCAIYPPSGGGCGCGVGDPAGAVSLLLALLALRPRRR